MIIQLFNDTYIEVRIIHSNKEDDEISKVHPEWKNLVRTREFTNWMNRSYRRIRIVNHGDVKESIKLLSEYKEYLCRRQ